MSTYGRFTVLSEQCLVVLAREPLVTLARVQANTLNTRIKEPVIFCLRLMRLLYIGCVVRNQPGVVLERFLKLFLEMLYRIY